MTRNGKIARLPHAVREELNRRLLDGEQGTALVAWLNERPDVQAVMTADFGGRAINEQNLSDWKLGGFEEWREQQESFDLASGILEEAKARDGLKADTLLSDRVAEMAALSLARLLRASGRLENGAEQREAILHTVREVVRLRRTDREYEAALRERDRHRRWVKLN